MTPEAQRIAIAEACSWRCTASFKEAFACWVRPDGMDHQTEWLPDYLNDLNAMHEAEMSQVDIEEGRFIVLFREYLHTILGHDGSLAIHATAAQRAEAFLRSLGKWEDAK